MSKRQLVMIATSAVISMGAASYVWAGCGKCEGAADKGKSACGAAKCEVKCEGGAAKAGEACGPAGCAAKGDKAGAKEAPGVAAVNTSGLATLIRAKVPVVILDARSGKYDDGRRIPGAKALAPDAAEEEIAKVAPDKKALIVTYCGGLTCPASNMLCERLKKMGYENVVEYPEGIAGWTKDGNSVEGGGK